MCIIICMIIAEIKKLRLSRGLTQSQLAHQSGVSLPTIQNIEALKANPSLMILERILDSLDAKLELSVNLKNPDIIEIFNMDLSEFKKINLKLLLKKLNQNSNAKNQSRHLDLFIALYAALLQSYPNWLKKNSLYKNIKTEYDIISRNMDLNRHIKFRRIWLSKLSQVI